MKHTLHTLLNNMWILAIFAVGLFFATSHAFADTQVSIWFKDSQLEFSIRKDTIANSKYPTSLSGHGNADCSNLTLTKRDGDPLLFLPVHIESQVTGCYMDTSIGPVDSNGFVNVSGTEYAAEMTTEAGVPVAKTVFPNSDYFVNTASNSPAVGQYIWLDHLQTSVKFVHTDLGKIQAQITSKAQVPLQDASGTLLPVMTDNFSASDNGEWLVFDSPGKALIRVNLATMQVLPFAQSFEYDNGIGAAVRTAISSDGRFVAVASKNYNFFKLYDLSTCGSAPNIIKAPLPDCKSRDLLDFAHGKINDMSTVLNIRFLTDELIHFYASYDTTTTPRIGEFIIAAPGTYLTGMDYLGMGDSIASGEGAQKYEVGTDEQDANLCHLSKVSYPYLLAKKLQANNFHSVACSGARTFNVKGDKGTSKDDSKKDRDNQYNPDHVPANNNLGDWIPGYKKQVSFVSINNPKIITVNAGGNDIGFSDKIKVCLKPFTCYPTYEDRQEVFNEIDGKLSLFTATFKKLKEAATKNARVYVVSYPQVAFIDGNCGLNVHLDHEELLFADSVITRLNTVIKVAAQNAEVNYVDISTALNGFRLCENNAGNIAMNGLTAGNDIAGVVGNESFHPNEFGHELIANKILALTNNLGGLDPQTFTPKLEKIKDTDPALKNAPKTNRVIRRLTSPKTKTKPTAKKRGKVTIKLKGSKDGTPPKNNYNVSVGGTHTGTVTTDQNGDADVDVVIPPDTTPGPTAIDIIGNDATGNPVDIVVVVDVGNEGDDFDGDGIVDASDSCPGFVNSGQDADQDGIDDVCDPVIGPAPITTPPTTTPLPPTTTAPPPAATSANSQAPTTPSSGSTPSSSASVQPSSTNATSATPKSVTIKAEASTENGHVLSSTNSSQPKTQSSNAELQKATQFAATTDKPTSPLRQIKANISDATSMTKNGFIDASSTHPLAFLAIIITLLLCLLVLAYLRHRSKTRHSRMTTRSSFATA